jgi:hypothetical protein
VVDIRVQWKTVNLIIIFIWKEVYVVGQVDVNFSDESDESESDHVKRRDRRGYIDLISKPAHCSVVWIQIRFKMEWVISHIGITSRCQLLFKIMMQILRPESSSQIISECDLSVFHNKNKPYYQDERCNLQSSQHGNLHSFLNSLDEIRLADIKFKRFKQVFNSSNYQRMCISRKLVAYKGWINVAEAFLNAYGSTLAFLHI